MNKDYRSLSAEKLVWDEEFRKNVLQPDEHSKAYWERLSSRYPDEQEIIAVSKQVVLALKIKDVTVSDQETTRLIQNVLDKIDTGSAALPGYEEVQPNKIKRLITNRWSLLTRLTAASFILIITAIFLLKTAARNVDSISYTELVRLSGSQLLEKVNLSAIAQTIVLQDGSKITLAKDAKLSYPATFDRLGKREVYLSGEASFEVARQPERPFFVYSSGLITKVLGTVFKIRSYEAEKKVTVEVVSGAVSVYSLIDKKSKIEDKSNLLNSLVLTRNQKASFSSAENSLMTSIVDAPVLKPDKEEAYRFVEKPIEDVFKAIEYGYGIDVIFDDKVMAGETLTANLAGKTMYDQLNIICKAIGAHYEIIDGRIVIFRSTPAPNS